MTRRAATLVAAFAAIAAVYLLYLPHALPVLDDWMYLDRFDRARAGGIGHQIDFLGHLIDNSWLAQFRIFWASLLPIFGLSLVAGFSGWPYFLLAWAAHLLTAVLLARIVATLADDAFTGFAAGAVYAVFPASNNALFWPVSNCIYYLQVLAFCWWFHRCWLKLAVWRDFRYRWRDLAALVPVLFSGEQALTALALLLPLAWWLFGRPGHRGAFLRFWAIHLAVMAALVALYAVLVNRMPIAQGFRNRYAVAAPWSLTPPLNFLFGSLGWKPEFSGWRPDWRPDAALAALVALAVAAFVWGWRRSGSAAPSPSRMLRLLAWSLAGVVVVYLPLATLNSFEWRYLYVSSAFLVPAVVAALGWLPFRARFGAVLVAVIYGLSLTYFEMRQCWIPQSRVARGILNALADAGPIGAHEVLIFSGSPIVRGPAADFITGASWSLQSMLEHYTQAEHVQGARDLVVNEQGALALHRRDSLRDFQREDLGRLRVFVRDDADRFQSKCLLALPMAGDRFELVRLRGSCAEPPPGPLTLDALRTLAVFDMIYFPRRIRSGAHSTDL